MFKLLVEQLLSDERQIFGLALRIQAGVSYVFRRDIGIKHHLQLLSPPDYPIRKTGNLSAVHAIALRARLSTNFIQEAFNFISCPFEEYPHAPPIDL